MFPVLRIGPLALQTAGLAILLGFWLALELASRQAARQGLKKETVHSAGFYGAIVGIIGARMGYAIAHWSVYRHDLLGLIALNPQTLHPLVGLITGAIVAFLYLRKRGASLKSVLDAAAPGLAVVTGFQALADFASGQDLGATTAVPWGVSAWGEVRHPVQLYELGLWVLGAVLIWRAGRAIPAPGALFMLFLATYGVALLVVEPFRARSTLILGGIRAEQLAGLLALLAALWLMRAWWVRSARPISQGGEGGA